MPLPTFRSLAARRKNMTGKGESAPEGRVITPTAADSRDSERTLTPTSTPSIDVKLATRTRRSWILISSFLFFISVIFLILVEIGNINKKTVIRNTYFFSLNLTNIIPASVGDIMLVNSLARSLGLHDFYQVGLWNFCEGYNNEGITYCSPTRGLYWFNPVEILLNELLSGATIALPAEINNILDLIKIASHLMFGFFLTGACMNFVSIFLAPITLYSRWWSLPFAIFTFIAALLTTGATIIATVMFIVFKNVVTSQPGLNIGARLGTNMFVFMWIASAFSIIAFVIHVCLSCCCASRRDVKSGRRKGRKSAYGDASSDEKKRPVTGGRKWGKVPKFYRRKTSNQEV
jgi:hypothetical protein